MRRKKRLPDGTLSTFEDVFGELSPEDKLGLLGAQLAQEKLSNMQKDSIINNIGAQMAIMKLEIMQLKGGEQ